MAKWGEGDPRWIVEDRPDATNVNNWHWVEKNATNWSKEKLKELLVGLKVENEKGSCELKEISSIEGEASANNRKGKLIFFYELEIKGEWSGILKDDIKSYKGKYVIPNLSEENAADEIDLNVTADKSCNESYALKEIVRIEGTKLVRKQMERYITELTQEFGQNIILPTKGEQNPSQVKAPSNKENKPKQELNKFVSAEKPSDVGAPITTKTLKMYEEFTCEPAQFYNALTMKQMVEAYMGGDIIFEAVQGSKFSLAGGNIIGEFVELIPGKKLVQQWRFKSWPAEHYSKVTIDLEAKEGKTKMTLTQTGVPSQEFERTKEGWKANYWERMRPIFGFGTRLF